MDEKKQIAVLIEHYLNCEISSAGLALYLHLFRLLGLRAGDWFHVTESVLPDGLNLSKGALKRIKKELIIKGFMERKRDAGRMWYRFVPLYC